MGRSSKAQKDENRARIVAMASGLFRAYGVDGVGISDVMQAAGMTQGGFYKHFDTKEALAAEACSLAFHEAAERWRSVAEVAQAKGKDVSSALVAYYLAEKPPEMTCPMIALSADATRGGPESHLQQAYGEGVQLLLDTFLELSTTAKGKAEQDRLKHKFSGMVGANMLSRSAATGKQFAKALTAA